MKKYIFVLWQQLIYILRLVAAILGNGQNCAVCEASCRVVPVCEKCEKTYFSVRTISFGICRVCGKRLVSENKICTECRKSSVLQHTDGVFPLFSYRLWNIDLLCRWKMQEERQLSPFFAGKLASRLRELSNYFPDFAVIPVPPRPGKIRREGWDQVQELSEFLEYEYGFTVLRILERRSVTEQKTLARTGRIETVGKSYCMKAGVFSVPDTVCLLDDVITTGATVESCASVLKSAGAKNVLAVSLFTVDS